MIPEIYLMHGIHAKSRGAVTTDRLRPFLEAEGFTVHELDYAYFNALRAKLCNPSLAMAFSEILPPGANILGHSNAGAIIYRMAKFEGFRFGYVSLLQPALDKNKDIEGAEHVDVWYASGDRAVWLAQWIPGSIWGCQGRVGYQGKATNTTNLPLGNIDHSEEFVRKHLLQAIARRASLMIKKGRENEHNRSA